MAIFQIKPSYRFHLTGILLTHFLVVRYDGRKIHGIIYIRGVFGKYGDTFNRRRVKNTRHMRCRIPYIGNFRVGLIFAKFATFLKSPKIDSAKNKTYLTSTLRVLEIAKICLSENLTYLQSVIFAKKSRREKFLIYGIQH